MKRGRPNIRRQIQQQILETLSIFETPITVSALSKEISKTNEREISWNTINKYVQELVEAGKIQPIQLPHSKDSGKNGLVVYTLKK